MPAATAALFGGEVCGALCYSLFTTLWSHGDGICIDSFAAFVYCCAVAARPGGGQILNFQQLHWPLRIVPLSWGAEEGLRGSLWPQLPIERLQSWEDTKVLFKHQIQVVNTLVLSTTQSKQETHGPHTLELDPELLWGGLRHLLWLHCSSASSSVQSCFLHSL